MGALYDVPSEGVMLVSRKNTQIDTKLKCAMAPRDNVEVVRIF
jgi:hypothetical protein